MNWFRGCFVFLCLFQIISNSKQNEVEVEEVVYEDDDGSSHIFRMDSRQLNDDEASYDIGINSTDTDNDEVVTVNGTTLYQNPETSFSIPYAKSYPPDPRTNLSNGAVAGIMVAVLVVIGIFIYFYYRYKNKKKLKAAKEKEKDDDIEGSSKVKEAKS